LLLRANILSVAAVALEMAVHRETRGCLPGSFEYDETLQAVVPGIAREVQNNRDVHMRVATEDALAKWARVKYCKE
jgi:hypothetical protein